ncbi:MAG TPA: LysM peptidoglycan-binding domain-containing protein, partial [Candidatus Acidoferrales bacterium]|nr:LysM peptidoglycan-binding domain-containing protein [Candidatus Acidoferrales bacterium]
WNNLRGDTLARGVSLKIYPGGKPLGAARRGLEVAAGAPRTKAGAAASRSANAVQAAQSYTVLPTIHLVQAGETLWSIARAYQTTVESLRRANGFLAGRQLRPGDQVRVQPPH